MRTATSDQANGYFAAGKRVICFEWPDKSSGPTNVEIVDYH